MLLLRKKAWHIFAWESHLGEKVDSTLMTCQTVRGCCCWATPRLETTIHSKKNCTMTSGGRERGGLRIPCTVAHRPCRCSSRCACSPGPPEVAAGTVLSWTVPGGGRSGAGWRPGWPGIPARCRGGVPAGAGAAAARPHQPRSSAWRIWPAAGRPSPAACARLSRCGCRRAPPPGCPTASSSWWSGSPWKRRTKQRAGSDASSSPRSIRWNYKRCAPLLRVRLTM